MEKVSDALVSELVQRKNYLEAQKVETVYFGGGTPSILKTADIERIVDTIRTNYELDIEAEITLEANPDDLTPGKLNSLKKAGINRLSIGIQSFAQEDLAFLSRSHTSEQVIQCISDAKQAGFHNLSIDLIYGIPTLTDEVWMTNLETAFSLGIPHISAYSLTINYVCTVVVCHCCGYWCCCRRTCSFIAEVLISRNCIQFVPCVVSC